MPSIFDKNPLDTPEEAALLSPSERKCWLMLKHPDESPKIIGILPYLIHPPSRLSTTAKWIAFRDRTVVPMMQQMPDDPNLPNFLKQVEVILAWRSNIPQEDRFWKADPPSSASAPTR